VTRAGALNWARLAVLGLRHDQTGWHSRAHEHRGGGKPSPQPARIPFPATHIAHTTPVSGHHGARNQTADGPVNPYFSAVLVLRPPGEVTSARVNTTIAASSSSVRRISYRRCRLGPGGGGPPEAVCGHHLQMSRLLQLQMSRLQLLPTFPPLRTGSILTLCYLKVDAPGSAYAGILTPRTSTTGAEQSARFVQTARVGSEAPGRSCASSRG
jgi:hypothetical protein